MIEPSQARYRMAHAFQRLSNALGVQLLPTDEDCVCLEKLASQAERWARPPTVVLDEYVGPDGMGDDWHMSHDGKDWVCFINGAPESLKRHTGRTAELARFAAAWKLFRSASILEANPDFAPAREEIADERAREDWENHHE